MPPPIASRANEASGERLSRTTVACRRSWARYAVTCSAGGLARVNRLQKPHRISQNGRCTYPKSASCRSPAHTSRSGGRGSSLEYAVLCGYA